MSVETQEQNTQTESQKQQEQKISSEEETDYSDDSDSSELSNESNTSTEEVKEISSEPRQSVWNRLNGWIQDHRQVSYAVAFGLIAVGVASWVSRSS